MNEMRRWMTVANMLRESMAPTETIIGKSFSDHHVVSVIVNPGPGVMGRLFQKQLTNGKQGIVRVVSSSDGNIAMADGYDHTHFEMMMVLQDSAHPLSDDDSFEEHWILAVEPKPGPRTHRYGEYNVEVAWIKDTDGYATGKRTFPRLNRWPEGLRRAFGTVNLRNDP
jgi:hypothetical protein